MLGSVWASTQEVSHAQVCMSNYPGGEPCSDCRSRRYSQQPPHLAFVGDLLVHRMLRRVHRNEPILQLLLSGPQTMPAVCSNLQLCVPLLVAPKLAY